MCLIFNFVLLLIVGYSQQNIITEGIQKLSIPNYIAEKIREFLLNKQYSPLCVEQLSVLANALAESEEWALRMLDATGKIPSGLLEGNTDLGSFDECLAVESHHKQKIIGQYCIGDIKLNTKTNDNSAAFNNNSTNLGNFKATDLPYIQIRQSVCVPNGCSANDTTRILFDALGLHINFTQENCQTKYTQPKLNSEAIAFISLLGVLFLLIVSSTLYELYYYYYLQEDTANSVLVTFSILTNGKKLLTKSKNPDIISSLHGMRVLSMVWIIAAHSFSMQGKFPAKNFTAILEWVANVGNMYILGGSISVDTFLLISGLALMYSYLIYMSSGKKFNLLVFYLHRYLRLTPLIALLIVFQLTILKYFGSGPLWPASLTIAIDPCRTDWWRVLLFIQNYGDFGDRCLPHTWYLGVDTQLYVLSPIILLPLNKWPKATLIATSVLTVISIGISFYVGWMYDINAHQIGTLDLHKINNYFLYYYRPTHTRASVWLIGLLYGYALFMYKRNIKLTMNKVVVLLFWIISLAVVVTCVYAGHDLILQTKDESKLENALYLSLLKPSWGIAVGWIIFACATGYGGPINWFLSLTGFEVLGRLSYAMYLIHWIVMSVHLAQIRTPAVMSTINQMYFFWGNFGFTIIFSVIAYLGFEYPIALVERRILGMIIDGSKKETPDMRNVDKSQRKEDQAKLP